MESVYGTDVYAYLVRARQQLDSRRSDGLFYAAFELRCAVESDHAGGRRRPRVRAAAGAAHADSRRNDDREAVREQLDVHAPHRRSGDGARRVHRRTRLIPRPRSDRRRHYRHVLEAIALVGLLAGCGGGGSSAPTIAVGAAHTYELSGFTPARPVATGTPTRVSFTILQPNGKPLTQYKHGAGPHNGVHLIIVRRDLAKGRP